MKINKMIKHLIPFFAVLLLLFIVMINISSTFAYYAYKVPVINNLVALTLIDKDGITTVDGKYGQLINKFVFKKDVVFTINEVVSTEDKIVFMCTVNWFGKIEGVPFISNYKFKDEYNNDISINGGSNFNYDDKTKTSTGIIILDKKNSFSSKVKLIVTSVQLPENKTKYDNWEISVFIDKEKSKEKQVRFPIDKVIKTEDGSIKITDIGYSLTKTEIFFQTNGRIKNFGAIDLVNSDGSFARPIRSYSTSNNGSCQFETLYPFKAKEILVGSVLEEYEVVNSIRIDLFNEVPKTVAADSYEFVIKSVIKNIDSIEIRLLTKKTPFYEIESASLVDSSGATYDTIHKDITSYSTRYYSDYNSPNIESSEQIMMFKTQNSSNAYSGTSGRLNRKHPDSNPEASGHLAGCFDCKIIAAFRQQEFIS